MKRNRPRNELSPSIFTGLLAIIVLLFAFCSCIMLQNQKGYENYTKNTDGMLKNKGNEKRKN